MYNKFQNIDHHNFRHAKVILSLMRREKKVLLRDLLLMLIVVQCGG